MLFRVLIFLTLCLFQSSVLAENTLPAPVKSSSPSFEVKTTKKAFDLKELENLLSAKKYSDSVKMKLYNGYMNIRSTKGVAMSLMRLIQSSIPPDAKKLLIRNNNFDYPKNLRVDDIAEIYSWARKNNCSKCLENIYFVGKNDADIIVTLTVKKMIEHNIKNSYLLLPMQPKPDIRNNEIDKVIYFFMEDKMSSIFFVENDEITVKCKNTSYHRNEGAMIFWSCGLVYVNGNSPVHENELLKELRMGGLVHEKRKLCVPIIEMQKKLEYSKINIGKVDGRFGYKSFFGLMEFQRNNMLNLTGDLDERTCAKLSQVVIPPPAPFLPPLGEEEKDATPLL